LNPGAIEDVAPHREEGFGERGGLDRVMPFGSAGTAERARSVLGVAAALNERGSPCRRRAIRTPSPMASMVPRELQARNVDAPGAPDQLAGALHGVGAVDAGGDDL